MDKYPNIVSINRVSCGTGEGIELLIDSLNESLAKVNHLNTLWPKAWFELKEKLEKSEENFISLEVFNKHCKEVDIYSKHRQNTILDFLHDLGVVLHFKDFDLDNTSVLNPHWVTEGVYKIINSRQLVEQLGILSYASIENILPNKVYPKEQYRFLISLMEKFELCYKINRNEILIPDLLSVQEPDFNITPILKFIVEYAFLPRSIFPKFIVRMKNDVKESLAWRTGVILENTKLNCLARLRVDYEEKTINIEVEGFHAREYFSIIHYTLTDINNSFSNLSITERIPIAETNITVSYQHLKNLEELGVFDFIPEGSTSMINVSETLGSVTKTRKEKIEDEIMERLNEIKGTVNDKRRFVKEANEILELKPNIFGIGININAIVDKIFRK